MFNDQRLLIASLFITSSSILVSGCCGGDNAYVDREAESRAGIFIASIARDASDPSVDVDENDRLLLAYSFSSQGGINRIVVRRRGRDSWTELGSPTPPERRVFNPAIASSGPNAIALTWSEDPGSERVVVAMHDGDQWRPLPVVDSGTPGRRSLVPNVAGNREGKIALIYWSVDGQRGELRVALYDDGEWSRLPSPSENALLDSGVTLSSAPEVVLDSSGRPTIAWSESHDGGSVVRVARWDGNAWIPRGNPMGGKVIGDGAP